MANASRQHVELINEPPDGNFRPGGFALCSGRECFRPPYGLMYSKLSFFVGVFVAS